MLLWVLQKGRQEEEQGWRGQERACGSLTAAQCRTKQSVAGQATGQPRGRVRGVCNRADFHHLHLHLAQGWLHLKSLCPRQQPGPG